MTGGCSECVPGCTCGFGGEHVDDNPRCRANWEATAIAAVDLIEGRRVVTGEAGPVPDDVIEAVAQGFCEGDWGDVCPRLGDGDRDRYRHRARAAMSVPAVAEVFAKAALLDKVLRLVDETEADATGETATPISYIYADGFEAIAALFDGGDRP